MNIWSCVFSSATWVQDGSGIRDEGQARNAAIPEPVLSLIRLRRIDSESSKCKHAGGGAGSRPPIFRRPSGQPFAKTQVSEVTHLLGDLLLLWALIVDNCVLWAVCLCWRGCAGSVLLGFGAWVDPSS